MQNIIADNLISSPYFAKRQTMHAIGIDAEWITLLDLLSSVYLDCLTAYARTTGNPWFWLCELGLSHTR